MKKIIGTALLSTVVAIASPANAVVVVSGSGTLSSTDPTQLGRVTRTGAGTQSTWSAQKTYPGTTNATTSYVYDLINGTFASNAVQTIYYEITFNSVNTVVSQPFGVAYRNSFNPANIATNYLGDSGISAGGAGAGTPVTFQVIGAIGTQLFVNFSEVTTGNLPTDYTYTISAYSDANRGENFLPMAGAVPEPATWAMLITGFAFVGSTMRRSTRRLSAKVAAA